MSCWRICRESTCTTCPTIRWIGAAAAAAAAAASFGLPWLLAPRAGSGISPAWRAAWGSWVTVSLIAFLAWLLSGHPGNLWFLWVAGPYGIVLFGRWMSGGHPQGRQRRRR